MTEEENPFVGKMEKNSPSKLEKPSESNRAKQIGTSPARKSKLAVVHQKSKSLMNQLTRFKDDAMSSQKESTPAAINDEASP